MARYLITSALPYINGIKHLGNLVGSQLPADLYARFCRAMGHEVMFICATDEHGTPAELAAAKAGKTTAAAKKAPAKKAAAKSTAAKAPRKAAAGKAPSAALAAVIGNEPVARPEAVKKMWEYIKANNLQDPKDKRTIVADDKLRAVFGKDSAGMFELAGILGNHLGGDA
mgnify:CR=1 FL=1